MLIYYRNHKRLAPFIRERRLQVIIRSVLDLDALST